MLITEIKMKNIQEQIGNVSRKMEAKKKSKSNARNKEHQYRNEGRIVWADV